LRASGIGIAFVHAAGMSRRQSALEKRLDEILRRVEKLETENTTLRADNARLVQENAELRAENGRLRTRLERLERRQPKDEPKDGEGGDAGPGVSGGSPPDAGGGPTPGGDSPKRKRGGQPGHAPRTRALVPVEQVDEVKNHRPTNCGGCGRRLKGDDPDPRRHQVVDVPVKLSTITEHRLHALVCSCGERTCAELPEDVPLGAFGPRLVAIVGLLSGAYRLSKRKGREFLADVFGVSMGLGSVTACEQQVSEALATSAEEAREFARAQPVANVDDTSWPERNKKAFLWGFVTQFVTFFMIHARRTTEAAQEVMGDFTGILGADRLASFDFWANGRRATCWAHLDRKFEEWLTHDREEVRQLGRSLLVEVDFLFEWWRRVRDGRAAPGGPMTRAQFQKRMAVLRRRVLARLEEGASYDIDKVSGTCKHLLAHEESLWTFVHVEGVEPTNNSAERALRHGVLYRNCSFGTQSLTGSRFVERVLTTEATLRQQGRNVVAFVVQAVEARLHGTVPPSLLPSAKLRAAGSLAAYQATG
jgi:transposase